jgi:hypothetical protein
MRVPIALLMSAALVSAAGSMMAPAAEAGTRHWPREPAFGYVTAESRYSSETITAPVRTSAHGRREVRLPGGTWIECRRSCANTLRQETIDFWHIRNGIDSTGDDGPGYFRFDFRW